MKHIKLLLIFMVLATVVQAQRVSPVLGITIGNSEKELNPKTFFELGVGINMKKGGKDCCANLGWNGFMLGSEFGMTSDSLVLGPKIGYSTTFFLFTAGLSYIHYTDFTNTMPTLRPHAGISLFGFLDLVAGLNYSTNQESPLMDKVNKYNVSLIFRPMAFVKNRKNKQQGNKTTTNYKQASL